MRRGGTPVEAAAGSVKAGSCAAPAPACCYDEAERLAVLRRLDILDTQSESGFDRVTSLASRLFGVRTALVSLVDKDRQWFKSKVGIAEQETPRDVAFCNHAIQQRVDVFVVLDAHKDPAFRANPLVVGPPHVRFYAGAILRDRIGTLCILDDRPREQFSIAEKQDLLDLAGIVNQELAIRVEGKLRALRAKHHYISTTAHDLRTPLSTFKLALDMLGATRLDEEQAHLLDQAGIALDLMQATVANAASLASGDDVLAERDEGGGVPVQRILPEEAEDVDIDDLMRRCERIIEGVPKCVPVEFVRAPSAPQAVRSDRTALWQAAVHMLTNACSATDKGTIMCTFSPPRACAGSGAAALRIEVVDTGRGVSQEVEHLLFQPFTQQQNALQGAGLGLYNLRRAAQRLRGRCGGGNRTDGTRGAAFWIEIPSVEPASGGVDGRAPTPAAAPRPRGVPATAAVSAAPTCAPSSPPAAGCGDARPRAGAARPGVARPGIFACSPRPPIAGAAETRDASPMPAMPPLVVSCATHVAAPAPRVARASPAGALPLAPVPLLPSPLAAQHAAGGAVSIAGGPQGAGAETTPLPRALVVDDSGIVCKMLARALQREGFEVDTAENGKVGLLSMQRCPYHVVLMDFLMPVMNGVDATEIYREWEAARLGSGERVRRTRIIGISANAEEEDVQLALARGMDAFYAKPVSVSDLRDALAPILEQLRAREPRHS